MSKHEDRNSSPSLRGSAPSAADRDEASVTPGRAKGLSLGAVFTVTLTVLAALAVVAWLLWWPPPPPTPKVTITVTWTENEGQNSKSDGQPPRQVKVAGCIGADLLVEVTATELGFGNIKDNAGWPPELATGIENGLQSYKIEASVTRGDGTTDRYKVREIYATDSPQVFYLPIPTGPGDGKLPQLRFKPDRMFDASAAGVVMLAQTAEP